MNMYSNRTELMPPDDDDTARAGHPATTSGVQGRSALRNGREETLRLTQSATPNPGVTWKRKARMLHLA